MVTKEKRDRYGKREVGREKHTDLEAIKRKEEGR